MYMAYKTYASILIDKLIKAINKKLQKTQFGFRTGRKRMRCTC